MTSGRFVGHVVAGYGSSNPAGLAARHSEARET
jgi:hypothetical protein